MRKRGFTLIELLVVISIISLLASLVLASLSSAQIKARDVRRREDFRSINTAMELYYNKHGKYPSMPSPACPINPISCDPQDNLNIFIYMMNQLTADGDLGTRPVDPKPFANPGYSAYDYGAGNTMGVLFVTYLEGISNTTDPPFNSCRPFASNWCSSTIANAAFCTCHPY